MKPSDTSNNLGKDSNKVPPRIKRASVGKSLENEKTKELTKSKESLKISNKKGKEKAKNKGREESIKKNEEKEKMKNKEEEEETEDIDTATDHNKEEYEKQEEPEEVEEENEDEEEDVTNKERDSKSIEEENEKREYNENDEHSEKEKQISKKKKHSKSLLEYTLKAPLKQPKPSIFKMKKSLQTTEKQTESLETSEIENSDSVYRRNSFSKILLDKAGHSSDAGKANLSEIQKTKESTLQRIKNKLKENTNQLLKESVLKPQEKDVFEYIPDNSNYTICYNDPHDLYKDTVSMNKHFLDEISTNIYASPLNTYLSNVMSNAHAMEHKHKKNSIESSESRRYRKEGISHEKNEPILEEAANEPKYAFEFFKNKVFKYYDNGVLVELDPAKIKYNDSTEYEYNQKLESYKKNPLSYLNKLKCEVEDITNYIKSLLKENEIVQTPDMIGDNESELLPNEKMFKQILHNREVPELLIELSSLEKDINTLLNDGKVKKLLNRQMTMDEKKIASEDKEVKSLLDALHSLKNTKLKGTEETSKSKSGVNMAKSFDVYTLKNVKEKDVSINDLLVLERKITDLENTLGIDKMPLLPYDDLNHAILDLYNKLSLLDPNKLENIKRKAQNLQSEFLNLKKFKKEVLNISKDRGNYEESIDELFKMLDVWKKTHHLIPNILTRLQQLKMVHDNAHCFISRLQNLEEQQRKLNSTLDIAEGNINLINTKLDENINILLDTLKKFEKSATPVHKSKA